MKKIVKNGTIVTPFSEYKADIGGWRKDSRNREGF